MIKDKKQLVEIMDKFFSNFLSSKGFELVEVQIKPARERDKIIRFFVDKPGGITLDECAKLNEEMGKLIDEKNLVPGGYILEVNSPGLDRPLKDRRDFERVLGKKITVVTTTGPEASQKVTGKLTKAEEGKIELDTGGKLRSLPIERIQKAILKIEVKNRDKEDYVK
jgi:ribosome maturation factor RimP